MRARAGDAPAPSRRHGLIGEIAELREYSLYFLDAKLDRIRLQLRNWGLTIALGAAASFVLLIAVATTVAMILEGLAGAAAELSGGRLWVGSLAVGGAGIIAMSVAAWFAVHRCQRHWQERTVRKYENRQQAQRQQFGRDVAETARQIDD